MDTPHQSDPLRRARLRWRARRGLLLILRRRLALKGGFQRCTQRGEDGALLGVGVRRLD